MSRDPAVSGGAIVHPMINGFLASGESRAMYYPLTPVVGLDHVNRTHRLPHLPHLNYGSVDALLRSIDLRVNLYTKMISHRLQSEMTVCS